MKLRELYTIRILRVVSRCDVELEKIAFKSRSELKKIPLRILPLPLQKGGGTANQKQLLFNLSPPF